MSKGIRTLKRGDKIIVTTVRDGKKQEEILSYGGMDGMYARLYGDDEQMFNATGYVKQGKDGIYIFTNKDEPN